LTADIC